MAAVLQAQAQRDQTPQAWWRRDRRRGFRERRQPVLPLADRGGDDRIRLRDVRQALPRAARQRAEHVRGGKRVEAVQAVRTGQVHSLRA
jgi:hypothetical protein